MLNSHYFKYLLKLILLSSIFTMFLSCGSAVSNNSNDVNDKSSNSEQLIVSRVSNSSSVSIFSSIALEFSEDLNSSTVTSSNIFITDKNGTLIGSAVKSDTINRSKIILTPYKYLKPLNVYDLVIKKKGVQDLKGRMLSKNYYYRFITTRDNTVSDGFKISLIRPANNSAKVEIHSNVSIEFNRFIALDDISNIRNLLELRDSNNNIIEGQTDIINSIITFTPSQDLEYATSYTLELKKSLSDMYDNVYDVSKNQKEWNFRTLNEADSYKKDGFADLDTILLAPKQDYIVKTIKNTPSESIIVLATQNSLKLYSVKYGVLAQKPTLNLLSTLPISFQVNTMKSFNDTYLIVGSAKDGVYTYKVDSNSISELSHVKFNEYVYGVITSGSKAYSVGPKDGLRVYDLNNGVITPLNHTRSDELVMLDVIAKDNKIFVADYNGAVLMYDDNLSILKKISINGSVKRLISDAQSTKILVFNSTGTMIEIDTNGDIIQESSVDLANSIKDVNILVNGNVATILISDFKRYVVLVDDSLQNASIVDNNASTSVSGLFAYNSKIGFMVLVSSNGKLSIKNLTPDVVGPVIKKDNMADNILVPDGSISFEIEDDYLDSKKIIKENFTFKDTTSNVPVDYNISLNAKSDNLITCKITPTKNLVKNSTYLFVIKNTLTDMIGNTLKGGDYSINFQVEDAKLSLSGVANVNEGAKAKYTISLNRTTEVDLNVGVKLVLIDANSSDITAPSTTYVIPAGSKSTTFDIATINNIYENKDKKYSVELISPSSGSGGFSKVYTDTTAVITTILNDDIASVSSLTTNSSSVTEGSTIIYSVVLSSVAEYDKDYSYSMPYLQSVDTATYGVDYKETVSSNVTIDTINKIITVPAGVSNFNIVINTIDDTIIESSETYSFIINNRSAQGTITDNDYAAVITQPPPSEQFFVQ